MKRNRALKNKSSKDVAKKTPTLYGANIVGRKHKGYVATIPANLAENIVRKAVPKGELELFFNEDIIDAHKKIEQIRTIVNNKGKEVEVNPYERDVIRALNLIVDTMLNEEQVQKAIQEAPSRLRDLATRPKGVELRRAGGEIKLAIDIATFTKMIYPNVPLNGHNMQIVRNAIYSLLNKEQVFKFKNKEGTLNREIIMPFFTNNAKNKLTETIIDKDGKEITRVIFSSIELTLSPIFLYDYNRRSYKEPINMLNLLRTIKRRSSLIDTLLDILEPERGYCVRDARQAAALERKRLLDEAKALGKPIDEVELKTKLDKVKRKYLTFDKYSIMNILDRVNNRSDFFKTYTSRKGEQEYLRSSAMDKLKAAAQELIDKIGIITEFYIGGKKGNETAADGALKAVFVFNENWLDEQTARMKANQKDDEKT